MILDKQNLQTPHAHENTNREPEDRNSLQKRAKRRQTNQPFRDERILSHEMLSYMHVIEKLRNNMLLSNSWAIFSQIKALLTRNGI